MTLERVVFSGNSVEVGGKQLRLDFPVRDAFRSGDRIIVLFDPDAQTGSFKNLVCFDISGKRLWEAEFPEPGHPDCYYQIGSRRPLIAYSFTSYDVELDPETGAILSKEFTK